MTDHLPATEPFDPAGAVLYAPGSIVSKTLLQSEHGTVTLFAFDQGQGLSEHTAPYDALVLVLEGTASAVVDDTTLSVTAGEMLRMPAHKPHAIHAPGRFKMLLIMVKAKP